MPIRSRRLLTAAVAMLAQLTILAAISAPNAVGAGTVSGEWDIPFVRQSQNYTVPPISAPEAIAYLNEQRAANGIPGTLVEEPELSQGCLNHVSQYVPAKGQFPHTELASQPGYTALGKRAAMNSDLAFRGPQYEWWGPESTPWVNAPLHLGALFFPQATSAWFGEAVRGLETRSCMGVNGSLSSSSTPTFYSVPGNGAKNVPFAWNAVEEPYTPGQAVGIPQGTTTGPYIILYPSSPAVVFSSASLAGPNGEAIPTVAVPPTTAAPASAGWPQATTLGGPGAETFVIVRAPLAKDSHYVLEAHWASTGGQAYTQQVAFDTGKLREDQLIKTTDPTVPGFHYRINGRQIVVTGFGPSIGQTLSVSVAPCRVKKARGGASSIEQCPYPGTHATRLHMVISKAATTLAMPRIRKGGFVRIGFSMRSFPVAAGKAIYHTQAFDFGTTYPVGRG
jgi:hypothetical protein